MAIDEIKDNLPDEAEGHTSGETLVSDDPVADFSGFHEAANDPAAKNLESEQQDSAVSDQRDSSQTAFNWESSGEATEAKTTGREQTDEEVPLAKEDPEQAAADNYAEESAPEIEVRQEEPSERVVANEEENCIRLPEDVLRRFDEVSEQRKKAVADFRAFKDLHLNSVKLFDHLKHCHQPLEAEAERIIDGCRIPAQVELPEPVIKTVRNSEVGLKLVVKMTRKLGEKIPEVPELPISDEDFKTPDRSTLTGKDDEQVEAYLRSIDHHNHGLSHKMRVTAEDTRQAFFSFVKNHLLPIIDGIGDGRKFFKKDMVELVADYQEARTYMESWFDLYDHLIEQFEKLLKELSIERIAPKIGDDVDYDVHEPFETVEDEAFRDESVYDLVRPGYRYSGGLYKELSPVIRPAQVIVAINKGDR